MLLLLWFLLHSQNVHPRGTAAPQSKICKHCPVKQRQKYNVYHLFLDWSRQYWHSMVLSPSIFYLLTLPCFVTRRPCSQKSLPSCRDDPQAEPNRHGLFPQTSKVSWELGENCVIWPAVQSCRVSMWPGLARLPPSWSSTMSFEPPDLAKRQCQQWQNHRPKSSPSKRSTTKYLSCRGSNNWKLRQLGSMQPFGVQAQLCGSDVTAPEGAGSSNLYQQQLRLHHSVLCVFERTRFDCAKRSFPVGTNHLLPYSESIWCGLSNSLQNTSIH